MLDLLTRRVSIENPNVPLTARNVYDWLGRSESAISGVEVSRTSILGLPAVWRAVNLITDAVATAPVHVFKRRADGRGKDRDRQHAAYRLLRHQPHEQLHAFAWKKTLYQHALIEGSGFAYVKRDGGGRPLRMTILDPTNTFPTRADGELWYVTRFTDDAGVKHQRKLYPENVIHIRGLAYDGLTAYRLTETLTNALGGGLAVQRYGGKFFANDARPGLVLEVPYRFQTQVQVDKFREAYSGLHEGLDNVSRPAVVDGGGKVNLLGGNNEEAQMLGTRELSVRDVAVIFGLPPHLVGDPSRTSFASLEQENKALLLHGINPWLVQGEAEFAAKLLTEAEKESDSHTIRFERKAFMAVDQQSQAAFFQMGLTHRVFVPNDVREFIDMNPTSWGDEPLPLPNESPSSKEPAGDDRSQPLALRTVPAAENFTIVGQPLVMPEDVDQSDRRDEDLERAHRLLVEHAAGANLRRIAHQSERAARRPSDFLRWLDEDLESKNFAVLCSDMRPAIVAADMLRYGSTETDTQAIAGRLFGRLREELLELSGRTTAEHLPERVEETMGVLVEAGPAWLAELVFEGDKTDEANTT